MDEFSLAVPADHVKYHNWEIFSTFLQLFYIRFDWTNVLYANLYIWWKLESVKEIFLALTQSLAALPKIQKQCLHNNFMVDNNLPVLYYKFWVVLNFHPELRRRWGWVSTLIRVQSIIILWIKDTVYLEMLLTTLQHDTDMLISLVHSEATVTHLAMQFSK